MGFPSYQYCKHSGIDTLGSIPNHWCVRRLKYMARIQNGRDYKEVVADEGYPVIGSGGEFAKASKYLFDGESVLLGRKGTIDKPLYINARFWTVDTMFYTEVEDDVVPKYLYYCALTVNFLKYSTSTALPSMTQQDLGGIPFAVPDFQEQQIISRFLDYKTAQIDALIAKKQSLLEKLAEKRTALISHAVTKGLDPSVPMKDSGVAWLREIPMHWKMTRLKYATSMIIDCPHDTPEYSDEGSYLVVRTADLSQGKMDLSQAYRVEEDEYRHRVRRAVVRPDDILYGREGERWGFAATVPEYPVVCLGQRMMQFRVGAHFHSRFLMWHLNADCVYQQGALDTSGSTAPHVNVETIKNYWLVEPRLEEQVRIADFLDRASDRLDEQFARAKLAIEKLQEYRSALITNAVTGKIDVRNFNRENANA